MNPSTTTRPVSRTPTRAPTASRTSTVTKTVPRATTVRTTTVRGSGSRTTTITTTTATISPTATPEPSGGLAPGAIGGIAGGAVALVALVGVVFYKRRKRITATGAASKKGGGGGDSKDEPIYMHASNYSSNNHKNPPSNNGISGPMALTAESDFEASAAAAAAAPSPYRRPSQQDNRGPPGVGPFGGPGGDTRNNNFNQQGQFDNSHGGNKNEQDGQYNNNNHNNSRSLRSPNDDKIPLQHDYYDDVQDYYDGPQEPIGAQRSVVTPRDLTHGNLTPAPEYYLGKEDIDPRRDLRGLDEPETYIRKANMSNNSHQEPPVDQKGPPRNRRSSVSSDGESAYMTLEQAQEAHQKKMQGHKESIGSVSILIDKSNKNQPNRTEEPRSPGTPSFAHDNASIAISDSVMSMMPSLPPISSPMTYNSSNGSNKPSSSRPNDFGPMSPGGHDDPYAESAFSEDFSSYPNSPYYAPYKGAHPSQQHPYPQQPSGSQSPFPSGGYGPSGGGGHGGYPQQGGSGYRGNGYSPGPNHGGYPGSPPYNGYGGGGARPQRGPGGHHGGPPGYGGGGSPGWNGQGYGPGPGGRGPPPSNYGSQNGYNNGYQPRGNDPGPGGYRQHPSQQQRDPYYGRAY